MSKQILFDVVNFMTVEQLADVIQRLKDHVADEINIADAKHNKGLRKMLKDCQVAVDYLTPRLQERTSVPAAVVN